MDNIEDILEDLSYSMASPEAKHFQNLLTNKKFPEAKELLLEHIGEDEATAVINHLTTALKKRMVLVEINAADIPLVEDDQNYLVRFGAELIPTYLSKDQKGYYYFSTNLGRFYIDKVEQVWKITYSTD